MFNGGSHLGHHVVKTLTGVKPPPVTVKKKGPKPREIITKHDKGSIPNNIAFICKKLDMSAIDEAVPGGLSRG
ncbi:hypothetical protein PCANC_20820 [Puccinia coronata f. sp. avenae]|uniref:Uncharacterized protein n=1 Tax=Puccinia coronata f. sp. avenae TaxID=200324 RepID=A0A2N5U1D8_9BASI|nr:hypothetical protein PCANC_20820 [Puccinia coronata f. sp. avenae]PLW31557.1 hypothetical protein PCASD_19105 [Puccinia coronata f. sp. avenae]